MTNKFIAGLLGLFAISLANASEHPAFVDGSKPFTAIMDVNRQAQAWAVCAASYDIMSTIMKPESPVRSQQLRELSNGAVLSIGMTLVKNELEQDISPERFKTLWDNSKVAMTEWPQTKLTSILSEAEELGTEGAREFGKRINATVVICINNLEAQRKYLDDWHELANSGLLEMPKN